jgi:molybdenum cofactor guanylyltransferase
VTAYAAVVLAGGAGRRLGGPSKPTLPVAGRPLLHRVLAAVGDAFPRVVVGPADLPLPGGVERAQEQPPGGGPAVAAAAGLARVPPGTAYVALLAADLPLLTAGAVADLRRAAAGGAGEGGAGTGTDGALFVDDSGRRQWLCGVWRTVALAAAVRDAPPGSSLRSVLAPLRVTELAAPTGAPPPWYDCDTEADLRRVREWADDDVG